LKILHRILGTLLANGISFGLLFLFTEFVDGEKINNYYYRVVIGIAILLFIFGLPVFLSSLFTPKPKKYGAITGLLVAGLFVFFLTFYGLFISEDRADNRSPYLVAGLVACINGTVLGFIISYLVFKNKGWETASKQIETPETY